MVITDHTPKRAALAGEESDQSSAAANATNNHNLERQSLTTVARSVLLLVRVCARYKPASAAARAVR